MPGPAADLSVAAQLLLRSTGKRLRGQLEPAPDQDGFRKGLQSILDRAPEGIIRDYHWLDLPASRPPWVESGLQLKAGDRITYFACGRCYASRALDVWFEPALQIWSKIGDSDVISATRNSHSQVAANDGPLLFGNYFPNDWADPAGTLLQPASVYEGASGHNRILAIQWESTAERGLESLQEMGDHQGMLASELERLHQGDTTPAGWNYLWNLGQAEIFSRAEHLGRDCMKCDTRSDAGILQRDVDLPLTGESEISWQWCIDQLPSTLREDTVPSHDYMSLAVEFDNGKDITYYWSHNLPVGMGYDCPLPNWKGKEFHVVIRSGAQGLGEWHSERRNLHQDYAQYMGAPPARIVRVWFIASSVFQRLQGTAQYSDICLHQGNEAVSIL